MRRAPGAALTLAAAFALASSGCGAGHPRRAVAPGSPAAGRHGAARARATGDAGLIQALLDRRAAALQRGDAGALAATSTGAQSSLDRRAATRAGGLGLRRVKLAAARLDIAGRRAAVRVRVTYGLAAAPGSFGAREGLRVLRTRTGWRVRSLAGGRNRPPWDVARFAARRTRHFLLLTPPQVPANTLGALLERARTRLAGALPGVRPPARLAVLVAATAAQAQALTGTIRGVEGLAAIADAGVQESGPARRVTKVAYQRLLVLWSAFMTLDPVDRARVAAHELTHAALARRTSGRTPGWLVEGLAMYASGDGRAVAAGRLLRGDPLVGVSAAAERAARRQMSLARLDRPESLARLSGLARDAAYAYASAAAFAIADERGRRALLRLYDAFGDPGIAGRPGPALEAAVVRRVLHTSLRSLERAVRAYALARAPAA